MRTAQKLYEGIDIGAGQVGLITYMRTDSVSLSNDALNDIRTLISQKYGAVALPPEPRFYKTKAKNAQEAHEAIRPSSAMNDPEQIKPLTFSSSFTTKPRLSSPGFSSECKFAISTELSILA